MPIIALAHTNTIAPANNQQHFECPALSSPQPKLYWPFELLYEIIVPPAERCYHIFSVCAHTNHHSVCVFARQERRGEGKEEEGRREGGRVGEREQEKLKGKKNKQSACLASAIPCQTPELFALGGGGGYGSCPFSLFILKKHRVM